MRKTIITVVASVALALTGFLVVERNEGTPPPTRSIAPVSPRRALFRLQNKARAARGIARLHWSPRAARLGARHSRAMARNDALVHSHGYPWWHAWGENVGQGPSISDLFQAFMRSTEHRANILNPTYTRGGIGLARRNGLLWVTAVFYRP